MWISEVVNNLWICYFISMRKRTLTPKQQAVLELLKKSIKTDGQSPTLSMIREQLNLGSIRSVTQWLEALERKGYIKRDRFKHRGVSIIENDPMSWAGLVQIPVVSAGCDTASVYAQDQYEGYLAVDKKIIPEHKEIVAVKAVGDSMVDAGINNGDHVLVEVTDQVSDGDHVVAVIGDMAVIKSLKQTEGHTILYPESSVGDYAPIVMQDNSKIFGKVLSVIRTGKGSVDDVTIEYDPNYKKGM